MPEPLNNYNGLLHLKRNVLQEKAQGEIETMNKKVHSPYVSLGRLQVVLVKAT
jgi:hypothetical protein